MRSHIIPKDRNRAWCMTSSHTRVMNTVCAWYHYKTGEQETDPDFIQETEKGRESPINKIPFQRTLF